MDAIKILVALLLQITEPCLPSSARIVEDAAYGMLQALTYTCGHKSTIEVWQRQCRSEQMVYWGRPFLLEEKGSGKGIYMNRFSELEGGWHVPMDHVYIPKCTS